MELRERDNIVGIAIFFGFFALYLHTIAPHLAPYRDAGEMASLLSTLGVAHPPGYPLYTLLGRLFTWLPLGNMIYRINVFSAFCASAALVFLFLTLRTWMSRLAALLGVAFLGLSNPFWDLATVSEMYALGALFFCLLLFVTFRLKNPILVSFLMALGLGVRMDLLLLVPFFAAWFWLNGTRREIPWMAVFFAAGASVFLYLMARSLTNPAIDWANPDNLLAVLNSARRKNYSGTLDLLSLSYRAGDNFLINLKLYGVHLVDVYGWWGVALALFGLGAIYKAQRREGLFFAAIFLVTGPIFLYLANMPPNTHALAIVEASYLVPDIVVAVWIAWGIPGLQSQIKNWIPAFAGMTIAAFLVFNAVTGFHRASKRHNFFAHDYVENVFRSTPRNAIAVFQKDVQLFSLWAAQLVDHRRPDISLVPAGLSGSEWYWEMKRRWPAALSPEISLKEGGGWSALVNAAGDRPLVAGYDVDLRERKNLDVSPHGLLMAISRHSRESGNPGLQHQNENWTPASAGVTALKSLCLYRGKYIYGETPDFFSTDLIGDHARAHHQQGFFFMQNNQLDLADWYFRRCEAIDPTFARASSDRGYLAYKQGNIAQAYSLYRAAARKAEKTIQLAIQYKALPGLLDGCQAEACTITTQLGAMAERLGRLDEARDWYVHALSLHEDAQAHYNLAVTYWNRDWNAVIAHMQRAVELNPQMNEARVYLARAQAMAGKR